MTLFRVQPVGRPSQYETYQITAPVSTHWQKADCEDVGCEGYTDCPNCVNGWETKIDEATDLGKQQAYYIRSQSGRTFSEMRHGTLTVFRFEGHQRCFAQHNPHEHYKRLDKGFRHFIRQGDYRSYLSTREVGYDEWQDRFAEHQDKLATEFQKG